MSLLLVNLAITIIISFSLLNQGSTAVANQTQTAANGELKPAISINTDRDVYGEGDLIRITGYVYNGTDFPSNERVKININKTEVSRLGIADSLSVVTAKNGYYNHTTRETDVGKYHVTAITNISGKQESASTTFEIKSIFLTVPAFMIYLGIAAFMGLMGVIFFSRHLTQPLEKETEKIFLIEILRLICLTAIAGSFIAALLFSEVEIGANSPVGLVIKHSEEESAEDSEIGTSQWMINIGGSADDNYSGGIQIPATVLIFGVAGGYLRYLYGVRYLYEKKRISGDAEHTDREWGDINLDDKLALFKHSLRSIALFFLSPILAIGVWFIIFQGGTTGKYAIAALSLTVGLITEEVIQALIEFSRSILRGVKGITPSTVPRTDEAAPTVVGTVPHHRSTGVAVTTPITAEFSEPMDKSSLNNYTFTLKDSSNNAVLGTVSVSQDGRTATFKPESNLSPSTDYVATINTIVKDLTGIGIPKAKIWSFTTS